MNSMIANTQLVDLICMHGEPSKEKLHVHAGAETPQRKWGGACISATNMYNNVYEHVHSGALCNGEN